jgi:hypothetical protein
MAFRAPKRDKKTSTITSNFRICREHCATERFSIALFEVKLCYIMR